MKRTMYIKTWPKFYSAVTCGQVTAQLRKNDRNFRKGDILYLQEYDPKRKIYTGHTCCVHVTDVLKNFVGLTPGYCVLSIKLPLSATRFNAELAGTKG